VTSGDATDLYNYLKGMEPLENIPCIASTSQIILDTQLSFPYYALTKRFYFH